MSCSNASRSLVVWEWAQAALLAANLAWTTLCLGGYRAETMIVTSALTAALLFVHAAGLVVFGYGLPADSPDSAGWVARGLHPAPWFLVPFLVYAAANVVWIAPVRWFGWIDWFGWAQMIAVFWVVVNGVRSRAPQRALLSMLLFLAVTAVAMECYQRFVQPHWLMLGRVQVEQYGGRASGCFGIPNSMAALLLLVLPVTGSLTLRRGASANARVFFGWLTAVLVFGFVLTVSRGAWLGLAIALTLWPLGRSGVAWWRRGTVAAGVLAALALFGAGVYAASPVARVRFTQLVQDMGERSRPILWRAGWQMFRSHPIVGTGGGSFDVLFERYRPEGFLNEPKWAHNDYLNTLSDYGAIGFILLFGAIAIVAMISYRSQAGSAENSSSSTGLSQFTPSHQRRGDWFDEPIVRQALAIGMLAFSLQLFVDFHFKLPALAMAFATFAGVFVSRTWRAARDESSRGDVRRRAVGVGLLIGALALAVIFVPRFQGEAWRQAGREILDRLGRGAPSQVEIRASLPRARMDLDRAIAAAPGNPLSWSDRAYATAQWSRLNPAETAVLGRQAEVDADRAVSLAPAMAEPWVRRGVARDMQGSWAPAGDDFVHAMSLSRNSVLPWYHYAYHLNLQPAQQDLAKAMVAFCLRLDPNNPDALRLRQQLATGHPGP